MEDLQKTVNIQSFTYENNLLAASRDCKIYLATTPHNKNLRPLVFKGYSQMVLNDPLKQKKFIEQIKFLWKLSQKDNILQIISQHYRDRMVFIITQYCQGGNLALHIKNHGPFTEEKAVTYLRHIINGYRQIHKASIIHRNLEPSNILISGLDVKIADFSDAIDRKDALLTCKKEQMVGTLIYQAPQVLEKYKYSQMSDIYSIGLIFYAMLKGSSPFNGSNKTEILEQMKELRVQNLVDQNLSRKSKQFLSRILVYEAQKRMSVEQMFNYTFYEIPQLPLTKFFTFDDSTSHKSAQRIAMPPSSQNQQPSSKMIKLLSIINDSVPQKSKRKSSITSIHLKMSEELNMSKLSNQNDISIFIPSKMDLKLSKKESNNIRSTRKPAEETTSLDFEPSLLMLPSQKDQSMGSKKSSKYMSRGQIIIEQKLVNLRSSNLLKTRLSKKNDVTGRTLDTDRVRQKQKDQVIIAPFSIKTSRNQQPIEVVVHSPKKQSKILLSQSSIKEDTKDQYLILCYLLSQVFMARFLNRVVYYLEKISEMDNHQLCQALMGLRLNILRDIKELNLIDEQLVVAFKRSQEYAQLTEIVQIYEQKSVKKGRNQSLEKTKELLLEGILFVFQVVKDSSRLSEHRIKGLDHMVKCWQLINILQKGSLQTFHLQSRIQQLINQKDEKVTIQRFLDVYSRMKSLKLIKQ